MRTKAAAGIFGVIVIGFAACGEPRALGTDRLFLQAAGGVAIVEPGGGAPSFRADSAVPSHDWSTVVRTARRGGSTRIVAVDPSSRTERWSQIASGRLQVKAVSSDGDMAVLEPTGGRYWSNPTITRFVIARRNSNKAKEITLDGNFAPEAFSTDGRSLFVVQYRPARTPNRYQVRRLDLGTGDVHDVYTPDAELQESMRGTARIQAMSADGTRLYTLYTLVSNGQRYAFIHVLSLDELWAHCIDLPSAFAESPRSTALTVTPNGKHLFVANALEGVVAEIDTEGLTVVRTRSVEFGWGRAAHALYGSESLYLGSGTKVVALDASDLAVKDSWEVGSTVTGLQEGSEGAALYVGQGKEISILDPASGKRLGRIDPPGVRGISKLGKVMQTMDGIRTEILCAC